MILSDRRVFVADRCERTVVTSCRKDGN